MKFRISSQYFRKILPVTLFWRKICCSWKHVKLLYIAPDF